MKKRRHISNIIATILMFFISINSIPASAASQIATNAEVPTLTTTANNKENYVHLDWTSPIIDKKYSYILYSKESSLSQFQSIPSKGTNNDNVKVLNVYPGKNSSGKPIGDNLKEWMENSNTESKNGYGNGLIKVDEVDIDDFNKNAESYLLDSSKQYKYDVIMFGSWDSNASKDLSEASANVVDKFMDSGRGILFGHDTLRTTTFPNFQKLNKKAVIAASSGTYNGVENTDGRGVPSNTTGLQSTIGVTKTGLLTNYPWAIGNELKVPATHNSQSTKGDVWMRFTNSNYSDEDNKSNNNFYLTTWNNVAMIQTGHSNGKATPDEQKLLANTLFYLAQVTDNTSWDDHKGQDFKAPSKPNISSVNYTDKKVTVKFDESTDNGSTYDYYVEATEKGTSNKVKSDIVSQTVTTGLKGYSVVIDKNPNTVPGKENLIKDTTYTVSGELDGDFYVHVAAVDNAGNVSEVSTKKYSFPTLKLTAGEVENNTVKITAEGNDKVTKIVLPSNEEVSSNKAEYTVSANGTYEFSAFDTDGNKVTESIKVNNLATDVTLDVKANENSATANWSVSDKSQKYTYTLNSTREDDAKISQSLINETSFEETNAKDIAAPSKSDITKVNINRKDNTTTIKFNESTDKGTKYDFNVEAKSAETGLVSISETKSVNVMSGLKGYSVVVDNNANTIPNGTITTTSNEYTFDKAYEGEFYVHVAAVDNAGNISEVSTYRYTYPTLILTANTDAIVKDNVKITADATKSANKVVKIITPDGKEVAGDKTVYTVDVNGEYTFTAVDEDGNKTPETIVINNIVPDVILDVESNMNKTHLNEDFVVDLTINNIKSIFATEVKIKYDTTKLNFKGLDKVDGIELVQNDDVNGEILLVLASLGQDYSMDGKSTLIKLNFSGIKAGDALIDVTKGAIANGVLTETNLRDAECGETTVNIVDRELISGDGDKFFTLLDLSIIAKHYGQDPSVLLKQGLDLDLNLDGKIDVLDYKKCYGLMLKNPNHKF